MGALVVSPAGAPLRGASNRSESSLDALAHAEVLALRGAARALGGAPRLDGCTLYCSLEPCLMCLGAALAHRVSRVVFAARSEKFGALTSGALACAVGSSGGGGGEPCTACGGSPPPPPMALRVGARALVLECAEDAPCLRPAAEESARLLRVFFGGLRAQPRARCGGCGAGFPCFAAGLGGGAAGLGVGGGGSCWCAGAEFAGRPLLHATGATPRCLCPRCLRFRVI